MLIVFGITAALWMTRTAPFGGWQDWLNLPLANDAAVAMLAVVALCMIPDGDDKNPARLLDWETAGNIPWGVLILFAGGITIARAFIETGLSETPGNSPDRACRPAHLADDPEYLPGRDFPDRNDQQYRPPRRC